MTERQALLASIEHWEQNLDMLILNRLNKEENLWLDINIYNTACPLCIFHHNNCFKCIIIKCEQSPWIYVHYLKSKSNYKNAYKNISNEIRFLYSLLYKK